MKNIMALIMASCLVLGASAQTENEKSPFTQVDPLYIKPSEKNNIYIILEQNGKEINRNVMSMEDNHIYLRNGIRKVLDEYQQKEDLITYIPTNREKEIIAYLEKISSNTEPVTPQIREMSESLNLNPEEQKYLFSRFIQKENLKASFENYSYGNISVSRLTEEKNGVVIQYYNEQPLTFYSDKSIPKYPQTISVSRYMSFNFLNNDGTCQKVEVNKVPYLNRKNIKGDNFQQLEVKVDIALCSKAQLI